jgi:hypothetical protein
LIRVSEEWFPAKWVLKEVNWVEKFLFIIKVSHGMGVIH